MSTSAAELVNRWRAQWFTDMGNHVATTLETEAIGNAMADKLEEQEREIARLKTALDDNFGGH